MHWSVGQKFYGPFLEIGFDVPGLFFIERDTGVHKEIRLYQTQTNRAILSGTFKLPFSLVDSTLKKLIESTHYYSSH